MHYYTLHSSTQYSIYCTQITWYLTTTQAAFKPNTLPYTPHIQCTCSIDAAYMQYKVSSTPSALHNVQRTVYKIQLKTHNTQNTTYSTYIQYTIYNIQHTKYITQQTAFNIQHTTNNKQQTTYNIKRTIYNVQYTIYNLYIYIYKNTCSIHYTE